jgi:hypothetical protein
MARQSLDPGGATIGPPVHTVVSVVVVAVNQQTGPYSVDDSGDSVTLMGSVGPHRSEPSGQPLFERNGPGWGFMSEHDVDRMMAGSPVDVSFADLFLGPPVPVRDTTVPVD